MGSPPCRVDTDCKTIMKICHSITDIFKIEVIFTAMKIRNMKLGQQVEAIGPIICLVHAKLSLQIMQTQHLELAQIWKR